jgi:hypothetical protein
MKRVKLFAACCISIAAPCLLRAQPPASDQQPSAPDPQGDPQAEQASPATEAQDDQQPEGEAAAPRDAEVDSAQSDSAYHSQDPGMPDWVLGRYCSGSYATVYAPDHTITHFDNGAPTGRRGHWAFDTAMRHPEADGTMPDLVLLRVWHDGQERAHQEIFRRGANGHITTQWYEITEIPSERGTRRCS